MSPFVFVIFDKSTKEVMEYHKSEALCFAAFTCFYDTNLYDYKAINLNYVLRELDQ